MQGVILSGESITLNNDFSVASGANVYIGIKDMHCDTDRGDTSLPPEKAPNNRHLIHQPNSFEKDSTAFKVLRGGQIFIIRDGKTYNALGEVVR